MELKFEVADERKVNLETLRGVLPFGVSVQLQPRTCEFKDRKPVITLRQLVFEGEELDKETLQQIVDEHLPELSDEEAAEKAETEKLVNKIKGSELFKSEVDKAIRESLKKEDIKQSIIDIGKAGMQK